MRRLLSLTALILCLCACQTEVFPDAPTMVPVSSTPLPSGSPTLPTSTTPSAPHDNGQLFSTEDRYLEFVPVLSTNNQGRTFFAFFAYLDGSCSPLSASTIMSGTVAVKDDGVSQGEKKLSKSPSSGEPFLYLFPDLKPGHTYQIHASMSVDMQPYSGDFTYQAK